MPVRTHLLGAIARTLVVTAALAACGDISVAGAPTGDTAGTDAGTDTAQDTAPATPVTCEDYCARYWDVCAENYNEYTTETNCGYHCSLFAGWAPGTAGDVAGNSVACRLYHAEVAAQTAPEAHCVHAGPSGGNTCGSWCDNYCHLALRNCVDANQVYASDAECRSVCATFEGGSHVAWIAKALEAGVNPPESGDYACPSLPPAP